METYSIPYIIQYTIYNIKVFFNELFLMIALKKLF